VPLDNRPRKTISLGNGSLSRTLIQPKGLRDENTRRRCGGTNAKILATGQETPINTGPELTPKTMVAAVKDAAKDWDYDSSKSNSSQGHGEEIQKTKRSIVMSTGAKPGLNLLAIEQLTSRKFWARLTATLPKPTCRQPSARQSAICADWVKRRRRKARNSLKSEVRAQHRQDYFQIKTRMPSRRKP
jgi:hypothetical protein